MENLNVLITGASSGIGYELAKVFARSKCHVILVARNEERLEEIRRELARQGTAASVIAKDLTQPDAASELYRELKGKNIDIHVLVNSAGIGRSGGFERNTPDEQLRMIQLNMIAVTQLTHLFLQDMVSNRFGRIVNVASISSFLPTPMMSVYAATKAYVLSLSESLNTELKGKGDIVVTALCPGFTKTNFMKEAQMGKLESIMYKIAMSPETVAKEGYKALRKGKTIHVVGLLNKTTYLIVRGMPRSWVQKVASFVFKDRHRAC